MNKNKGFTLIELLVVIAIIGILASVVLASLNSARNKGVDAAVKSGLANMRAQAEIYYDSSTGGNGGGYTAANISAATVTGCTAATNPGSVFADPTVLNATANLASTSGATVTCVVAGATTAKATSWAISVPLKAGGSWCVDSLGSSKSGSAATGLCV
jgi:prepilin-type N-terminal cleavage/methylation domain-containing protein